MCWLWMVGERIGVWLPDWAWICQFMLCYEINCTGRSESWPVSSLNCNNWLCASLGRYRLKLLAGHKVTDWPAIFACLQTPQTVDHRRRLALPVGGGSSVWATLGLDQQRPRYMLPSETCGLSFFLKTTALFSFSTTFCLLPSMWRPSRTCINKIQIPTNLQGDSH